MNVKLAIRAFLNLIEEASSVDEQIKLWLNIENNSTLISSYEEFICELKSGEFEYIVNNVIKDVYLPPKIGPEVKLNFITFKLQLNYEKTTSKVHQSI